MLDVGLCILGIFSNSVTKEREVEARGCEMERGFLSSSAQAASG